MSIPGYAEPGGNPPPDPRDESISVVQAISRINLRKMNLDHIYGSDPTMWALNRVREHELDLVLEILRRVRP